MFEIMLAAVLCIITIAIIMGTFVIVYPKYAHWYAVRHPEVRNPEMPDEYWER